MTEDVLPAEEIEQMSARMKKIFLLSTKGLCERFRHLTDDQIAKDPYFLSKETVSWNLFYLAEQQEKLINQMQKDSNRMTRLTTWVMRMTAAVLAVAVLQVVLLIIQICSK